MPRQFLAASLILVLVAADSAAYESAYRGPYWMIPKQLSRRGKKRSKEVEALWPFFFEHNKEWILAERLRTRAGTPPTEEDRKRLRSVLAPRLVSVSPRVRGAAALAIGKLGGPGSVELLKARLTDGDPAIRKDALLAVGLAREPAALPLLLPVLRDADPEIRSYAALGLGLLGTTDAVPRLCEAYAEAVKGREDETAASLAVALGMIGDESAVEALVRIPAAKDRESLKVHVCQSLGQLKGESSRKWLLRFLDDRAKVVNAAAALALSGYADKTVVRCLLGRGGLKSSDRMTTLFAAIALGRIGRDLPEDDVLRKPIGRELRELAERGLQNEYAAQWAAVALGIMGDGDAKEQFRSHLRLENRLDFSAEVQSAYALAAGLLGDELAIPDLREIVEKWRYDPDFCGYAAFALGLLGDRDSRKIILRSMERSEKHQIRRSGCWALGLLGDAEDVPTLIGLLADGEEHVRGAGAIAIGLLGDRSAVEPLVRLIEEDEDPDLCSHAIAALGWLLDKDLVPRIPLIFREIHYRERIPVAEKVLSIL